MRTAHVCAAIILACYPLPFFVTINLTPSIPVGVYLKTSDPNAPYTRFCLDPKYVAVLRNHGVVSHGSCPDGSEPLIKPVIHATPTDPIILTAEGFRYRGKLLPNTVPKAIALDGKPLEHWAFGIYRSDMWAVSSYNANSYDSRYFGPINKASIVSRARLLLTF